MKKFHATILVVDNDENDLYFMERTFRKLGVADQVQLSHDGSEAIAYMKGEGKYADRKKFPYPTFIITDLKMSKLDGFAVLEFLQHNPQWAIIPTVVLSTSSDPDDIKRSYTLGASSYHIKPQSIEELEKLLSVLHAYWLTCEVPEVDITGKQLPTDSAGRLGGRFRPRQEKQGPESGEMDS